MIEFRLRITGTSPLLMHSARLADPLDPAAKAMKRVSGKRVKTEEDHAEMARLEFAGGLYLIDGIGPYLPGENVMRSLIDGAKISKQGVKVNRGVLLTSNENPLSYDGPRSVEGLWADENFRLRSSVKIGTNRVMRTRPMFRQWQTEVDGILDPAVINFDDLGEIAETAGQMIGLGDWRPRYGHYTAAIERVR